MSRKYLLAVIVVLSLVSIALAQNDTSNIFVPIRQIGSLRPSGIQYDPNFDRLVMVDLRGRLVLADAATFETQHSLYTNGAYNAYRFSHDGRYLALAIAQRVELWDTQTGELSVTFEPDGALLVQGPLHFTPDDTLLLFDSVVPAPQATRQSENDTEIIPWMWDVRAARREARSTLPSRAEAYAFFNFRNGLVIGPNAYLIAGLPERLQVIDGGNTDLPVIADISASRFERDPILVWRSMTDDFLYVNPQTENKIIQIDTQNGKLFDVGLERDLNYRTLETQRDLGISTIARIIGQPNDQRGNSLSRLLFGGEYQDGRARTIMLLDILQPLTMPNDQMGLLIYNFDVGLGRGVLELVRPQDVQQMVLSPDHARLMVRRASGVQAIEIYNLDSGVLEKTLYPTEPDGSGSHLLAYNGDGSIVLSDFQRFDVQTGEVLKDEPNYTSGFERYFFSDDNQKLVTIRGSQWQLWEIASGRISQEAHVYLQGEIVRQSPDAFRFLTRYSSGEGEVMEIVDIASGERRNTAIPYLAGRAIESITPSPDWQQFLVVYGALPGSQHYPGNEIAVYHFTQGQRLFIAGDDLPQPDGRQYGWLDDATIFVSSTNPGGHSQPERIFGLEYDASGLPACLVRAFPEQWSAWLPVWEGLTLSLNSEALGHLTERICHALPPSADDFIPALTPTAAFVYRSDATALPVAIPGVPVCLTQRFAREAIDYAALWREMTNGLSDEQIKNIEVMLCEGLISSVGGVRPTATPNINQIIPPTATPLEAVASTTDLNNEQALEVMAIDVASGNRSTGSYIPPHGRPERDLSLITNLFQSMQRFFPQNPVLSPDGNLLATTNQNGFIVIYRLTKGYDTLVADEVNAAATRQAEAPRSIGLLPTSTPTFENAGGPRPTLTPTVTPTPPPRTEAVAPQSQDEKVQEFCPARQLYNVSAPPPDYVPSGRLFAPPVGDLYTTWVLEPESGQLYPDDKLPQCGFNEGCDFSFDQEWMIRQNDGLVVSRPDGSEATVLFTPEEQAFWPSSIGWVNLHTLRYSYSGYIPDLWALHDQPRKDIPPEYRNPILLLRQFDPVSGILSEPFQPVPNIRVNGLPTSMLDLQPGDETLQVVSTPYESGGKYYIYDRATGIADYFARVDRGQLDYFWHPTGRFLYYRYPDQVDRWYVFDAETRQHALLGESLPFQNGIWSRDGRYSVSWFSLPSQEAKERLIAGQLLPKINIWDSETGQNRRYCLPETGQRTYDGTAFTWSPDNRYLAFIIDLPISGDFYPTPTTTPDIPMPTATATVVPLETQYQYQFPRTVVLDTQTGSVTVINQQISHVILWTDDGGAQ